MKRFGPVTAVRDVSLTVGEGEIVGLLGPNGAGKSTTLHMLLGLITPDAGSIELFGMELARHRTEALSGINFAASYVDLPGVLRVGEVLDAFARLYALRSPVRVFEIFFWPGVELVLWGFMTVFLQAQRVPFAVTFLLGAVLLWQVLHKASNEISMAFLEDIWSRNLLNVQVSPLSSAEYLAGLVLFSLGKVIFALAVMAALALGLYGFGVTTIGVGLVPFMGVLLVLGWSLGLVGIAAVLRFGENAQVIAWSIVFMVQPLAGIFYPVSVLPAPLRAMAEFLPASHVFEGMRTVMAGGPVPWDRLAWAAGLDVVYLAGTVGLFAWALTYARRHGKPSRFGE